MMLPPQLPRAARPFVTFGTLLRRNDFLVAPEQIATFLSAIKLLGPSSMADIRRAAHATLAPHPERRADFDALFDAHFLGETVTALEQVEADDDEIRVQEDRRGSFDPLVSDDINEAGEEATAVEVLSVRRFSAENEADILRRFAREMPTHVPRRRGYRMRTAKRGAGVDFRRTLREAIRNDGEVMRLPRLKRKPRQRNVLLLIDVSGSMKARTEAHLRFAHALAGAVERIEVFTFGTRLTRLTRAIRIKNREQALAAASTVVADWDGGTRIGDALKAFLSVPRFAGYARGAVTLILSDGLERGDHQDMTAAVARLSARSWRLAWLTPLAADPRYKPETAALKSILPFIDDLAGSGSTEQLCAYVLGLAQARAA
jgi:uncharacterized protein with von Willebrand factor type A (vWA) domain